MNGEHGVNQTLNNRTRTLALAVLCAGIFLAAVDQTVVVTVLPSIIDDLEGGFSSAAVERAGWIVSSYLFGYTVVLPLMGRVADRFGHRRTYIISMIVFAAGSLLCAFSWSLYAMVGFRAIQAIGGGAVVPITMAVVGHNFPKRHRAMAFGVIGAAAEAGGVLGPLYGSLVGQFVGWRAIFYLNLPLVAIILWLLLRRVPESKRYPVAIDYRSGALMALALGLSTAGISGAREFGWTGFGMPLLLGGLIFLVAFLISDVRSEQPLIEPVLYRNHAFAAANISHFLMGVALITALVQVPTFAYAAVWPQQTPSAPLIGGLLLIRLTVMIPVGALAGGWLTGRLGSRLTAVFGFALSALGLWQMSRWQVDSGELTKTADLLVTGFGFGMVIAPISLSAVNAVKKSMMASGSAVLTASRIIGMTVGLAAINSWGISEFRSLTSDLPTPVPRIGLSFAGYVDELRIWEHKNVEVILGVLGDFFLIAAVVCVVAVVPSLFLLKKESGTEE